MQTFLLKKSFLIFSNYKYFIDLIQAKIFFQTSKKDFFYEEIIKKGRNVNFQSHTFSNCVFNLIM